MLTVQGLVEEMGLDLVAGRDGAGAPIRWVHASELPDPTPWLSGGELILTTGMQLDTPEAQRELVERLASHHVAGLGFGTGFDHDTIPKALLAEARAQSFPVFEVPYALPFIAITEKAFASLVNEQYEVLQRSIAVHRRLERLLLEERGLDELVRAIAATIGGAVVVLDPRGKVLASRAFQRDLPEEAVEAIAAELVERARTRGKAAPFVPDHPELGARALVLPVLTGSRGGPQAWLAAAPRGGGPRDPRPLTPEPSGPGRALPP